MVMLKENDFLGNPFKTREDVEKGCRARMSCFVLVKTEYSTASS
jgi:hypothetical protein